MGNKFGKVIVIIAVLVILVNLFHSCGRREYDDRYYNGRGYYNNGYYNDRYYEPRRSWFDRILDFGAGYGLGRMSGRSNRNDYNTYDRDYERYPRGTSSSDIPVPRKSTGDIPVPMKSGSYDTREKMRVKSVRRVSSPSRRATRGFRSSRRGR